MILCDGEAKVIRMQTKNQDDHWLLERYNGYIGNRSQSNYCGQYTSHLLYQHNPNISYNTARSEGFWKGQTLLNLNYCTVLYNQSLYNIGTTPAQHNHTLNFQYC